MEQRDDKNQTFLQGQEIQRPEVGLSQIYLNLSIEAGKTYNGSFTVYSKNGVDLEGTVLSTNDKVVPEVTKLSGTSCRISFYFKGRLAVAGEEHFGDFLMITNAGEINLPYCVTVVPKKLWVSERAIGTIEEFAEFAKEDWKGAREAFFSKEFKEVFLLEKKEYLSLYQGLLKGRSKDIILDNFLQKAAGKKPLMFQVEWSDKKQNELNLTKETKVFLHSAGWGYAQGRIFTQKGELLVLRDTFSAADFQDGVLPIQLSFGEKKKGTDVLVIETVFQTIEIPVCWNTQMEKAKKEKKEKRDCFFANLLKQYISLRTGSISLEEYVERSGEILKGENQEDPLFLQLCCFQIEIIKSQMELDGGKEACQAMAQELMEDRAAYLSHPGCRNYFYYLMALYQKDRASILEASLQIRDCFEKTSDFYDFWMLMNVDRNLALDHKKQYDILLGYWKDGNRSPLLFLGLLDIFNQNPYYMESLDFHMEAVIGWGLRHSYVSLELARQFSKLAGKEKFYKYSLLRQLQCLYELKPEEEFLRSICSMLIKGNKTSRQYHRYFEQALALGLQIVGMNEYYLRTLDFSSYPILPKSLLLYFHYSNSLDARERAYLYTNILHYEKQYGDLYENYLERMVEFVRDQMKEGRMNRYLQHLYEYFLPEILKEEEMVKYLPNIIFKKKLTVSSPGIIGVYVCHDETEEEVYLPLVDGKCQVETYSDRVRFYFVDESANRYQAGINWKLARYLNENKYMELCLLHNLENKKVLLKWTKALDEKGEDNERIANMVLETGGMKNWMREKAVEQILNYHYEEKAIEDLNQCLDQINYRSISPSYRRTLLNYYMACDRMEDAYFGIELYGSDLVDSQQLYLLTCVGLYLHKGQKDEQLLLMAHKTFIYGKYNREILLYLRQYLEGRLFDLISIWNRLKEENLDTIEYEEKILNQMLFTGEKDERILDVLLSYLDKKENSALAGSMLHFYSISYFAQKKKVPESFFAILERQVEKKEPVSRMSKLAYLYRKSMTGAETKEYPVIKHDLEELCQEGIVFSFYEAFEDFFEIPSLLREMTFLTCKEKPDEDFLVTITDSQQGIRKEVVDLKELCPGYYHGAVYLLKDEKLQKGMDSLNEDREVELFTFQKEVEGSRRNVLALMEQKRTEGKKIKTDYEEVLLQMEEQLVMLSER